MSLETPLTEMLLTVLCLSGVADQVLYLRLLQQPLLHGWCKKQALGQLLC